MPQVKGTFERETKRMIRYTTDWGVIYIPKTAFAETPPTNIVITVTALEDE